MTRTYSEVALSNLGVIQPLLNRLADKSTESTAYQETMFRLGVALGDAILTQIDDKTASACLACTAEDADFLARGILNPLETQLAKVALTCLWNQRFSPFDVQDLTIAPIIREYREPIEARVKYLIVAKSIISSGCVVRTNLIHLIQKIEPEIIFIAAPVVHTQSAQNLKDEFEPAIYNKFHFVYFAEDSDRTPTGEVVPGIGGYIYQRLGLQQEKDAGVRYIPDIVKQRRSKFAPV